MIGRVTGPYRVLAKLGEGGMGVVYRARDTKLDRDVVVKVRYLLSVYGAALFTAYR